MKKLSQEIRPQPYEASDLLVEYLQQLGVEYVFGIPGGAIEPLYNALARSERRGDIRSVVARHESGAVFMADGYMRNSGKLGVCCTTSGPGATNAITGVANAYENKIPMLVITAQTALADLGKGAFQESGDTGVDIVGMLKYCTRYNSSVTHVGQLEQKLTTAIITAFSHPRGPVHLSIPSDILRSPASVQAASYNLKDRIRSPALMNEADISALCTKLTKATKPVFVLGAGCGDAIFSIMRTAIMLNAQVVTTPDGKGLVDAFHPLYRGTVGFAGHKTARETLLDPEVDIVVSVGASFGEWNSNGWSTDLLLNNRLVQVEADASNFTLAPMAGHHICGCLKTIFKKVIEPLEKDGMQEVSDRARTIKRYSHAGTYPKALPFDLDDPVAYDQQSMPVKPQWLMQKLPHMFPGNSKYLADTGNSFVWAIHYLHPHDRGFNEEEREGENPSDQDYINAGPFQTALEFAPMGWAIGSAVGTALACKRQNTVVCITGDGSWLMNGQELTVAVELHLPVVYIILNDSSLGMVKHGQRKSKAEAIGFQLPNVDFTAMARSVGAQAYKVVTCQELLDINVKNLLSQNTPAVIEVVVDPEQVPPMDVRIAALQQEHNKKH